MNVPKQWRLRAQNTIGEETWLTVAVRADDRVALFANDAVILSPEGAQKLRGLLGQAMAEALRGERW